jgi:hypothetical protein
MSRSATSPSTILPGDEVLQKVVDFQWRTRAYPQAGLQTCETPMFLWTPVHSTVDKNNSADQRKWQFVHNPQDLLPLPTSSSSEGIKER